MLCYVFVLRLRNEGFESSANDVWLVQCVCVGRRLLHESTPYELSHASAGKK